MTVPYAFSAATSAIPLSQLDANFNTTITLGNTAIQLGNTVTTLNNMTLANVTISSGNVTLTNVTVTTANVTTANITTAIIGTANVTTANVATSIVTTSETLSYGTVNGVAYLNGSKVLTTGSALTFDGTNLNVGSAAVQLGRVDVAKSTPTSAIVQSWQNSNDGARGAAVYLSGASGTGLAMLASTASGYPLAFGIDGTEQMRLTSTGLGIGTSSPAYKLDVNGQINTNADLISQGNNARISLYRSTGVNYFDWASGQSLYFSTQTSSGGAGRSTLMALDASGNLGLGVIPYAWVGAKALQVSGLGAFYSDGVTYTYATGVASNALQSGASTWIYRIAATAAARYEQLANAHVWYQSIGAPSAGGTITWRQALTMDVDGNLGLGETTPGSYAKFVTQSSNASLALFYRTSSAGLAIAADNDGPYLSTFTYHNLRFFTNSTERARITSSGNFVAGGSVALATNATDGFLYVPTCAGTPTGTPTAITGMAPIVVNTTNNKLYFYSGGAWRDAGP